MDQKHDRSVGGSRRTMAKTYCSMRGRQWMSCPHPPVFFVVDAEPMARHPFIGSFSSTKRNPRGRAHRALWQRDNTSLGRSANASRAEAPPDLFSFLFSSHPPAHPTRITPLLPSPPLTSLHLPSFLFTSLTTRYTHTHTHTHQHN